MPFYAYPTAARRAPDPPETAPPGAPPAGYPTVPGPPPAAPPGSPGFSADPSKDATYFLNADPTTGWWSYLTQHGLSGTNNRQKWAQGQQQRYYGQYLTEAVNNTDMGFYDWLSKNQPDLETDYMSQSPEQRGDFTSRSNSPRGRWVNVG